MTNATLEERLTKLEEKVAQLAGTEPQEQKQIPWWKKIIGVYKDDPEFDEAERLGREYRESLRPNDADDVS